MSDPLTIMMIDDNPADGDTVQRYLEDDVVNWTIDFEQAFSADEAFSSLRKQRFDLLLVDYHFPFGNGFDILRKLRGEGFDGPAIMLTGEGDEEIAGQAVTENLSAYLPKSELDPESLNDMLETALTDEGYLSSHDVTTGNRFLTSDDRRILQGPGKLLSELSSTLTQNKVGLILFEYFWNNDPNRSPESIINTGRDLASELTELVDGGIRRVNETVLGTVMRDDIFEDFRVWDDSKLLSIVRNTLSGDSFQTDNDGEMTLKVHMEDVKSSDGDPAQTLNRALDKFSTSISDHTVSCRFYPVEED